MVVVPSHTPPSSFFFLLSSHFNFVAGASAESSTPLDPIGPYGFPTMSIPVSGLVPIDESTQRLPRTTVAQPHPRPPPYPTNPSFYANKIQNYSHSLYSTTVSQMPRSSAAQSRLVSDLANHLAIYGDGKEVSIPGPFRDEDPNPKDHNKLKILEENLARPMRDVEQSLERQGASVDKALKQMQARHLGGLGAPSLIHPYSSQAIETPFPGSGRGRNAYFFPSTSKEVSFGHNPSAPTSKRPITSKEVIFGHNHSAPTSKRPITPPIAHSHPLENEPVRVSKRKERHGTWRERKIERQEEELPQPGLSRTRGDLERDYALGHAGGWICHKTPESYYNMPIYGKVVQPIDGAQKRPEEVIFGHPGPSRPPPTEVIRDYGDLPIYPPRCSSLISSIEANYGSNQAPMCTQTIERKPSEQRDPLALSNIDFMELQLSPGRMPKGEPSKLSNTDYNGYPLLPNPECSIAEKDPMADFMRPYPASKTWRPGRSVYMASDSTNRNHTLANIRKLEEDQRSLSKVEETMPIRLTPQKKQEGVPIPRRCWAEVRAEAVNIPKPSSEQTNKLQRELREAEERGERDINQSKGLFWGNPSTPEQYVPAVQKLFKHLKLQAQEDNSVPEGSTPAPQPEKTTRKGFKFDREPKVTITACSESDDAALALPRPMPLTEEPKNIFDFSCDADDEDTAMPDLPPAKSESIMDSELAVEKEFGDIELKDEEKVTQDGSTEEDEWIVV